MSAVFDPYHKWLGIPPTQQPPTHYRLLGLEVFEADRDVIDAAANQRMAYLQDLAGGEHGHHSQKLLNEVSAARRCLLSPTAKDEYDRRLREKSSSGGEVSVESSSTTEPSGFENFDLASATESDDKPRTASRLARAKPAPGRSERTQPTTPTAKAGPASKRTLWWAAGGAAIVALIGSVVAIAVSTSDEPKVAQNTVETKPALAKASSGSRAKEKEKSKEIEKTSVMAKGSAGSEKKANPPKVALPPPPAFHFAPPGQVLTEICDILVLAGQYNLFYVAHPIGKPNEKAWGRAVSSDLMSWKPAQMTFPKPPTQPGCVVFDEGNSSGLAKGSKPTFVAIFREDNGGKDVPTLRLAASSDSGQSWTSDATIVTLPNAKPGAVRHRVIYHQGQKLWLLVLAYPSANMKDPARAGVYSSPNLRDWKPHPEISLPDSSGLADFLQISVKDKPAQVKLFLVTENSLAQSAAFDGKILTLNPKAVNATFERSASTSGPRIVELEGNRRALVALLRPSSSKDGQPPTQMTLPMELLLVENRTKTSLYFMRSYLQEFLSLKESSLQKKSLSLSADKNAIPMDVSKILARDLYFADLDFEVQANAQIKIEARGHTLQLDPKAKKYKIGDHSGTFSFNNNAIKIRIVSDQDSLEFGLDGSLSYSLVPTETSSAKAATLSVTGSNATLKSFSITPLRAAKSP